jgi:hypothetical protein
VENDKIDELAKKISMLLEEYKIEVETFNLNVLVKEEYYQSIKINFDTEMPVNDFVLATSGDGSLTSSTTISNLSPEIVVFKWECERYKRT